MLSDLFIIESYLMNNCFQVLILDSFKDLILIIKHTSEQFQDGRGMYSNCTILV